MLETKITSSAEILYDSELQILFVNFHQKIIDLSVAKETLQTISELCGDKIHCNLINIKKVPSITVDARHRFASEHNEFVKAVAIVADSFIQITLANFYLKFSTPIVPTHLFSTKESAIVWLREKLRLSQSL